VKVILLGVFPPPIGGVAIHVQRFAETLRARGHTVEVLDYPGTDGAAKPAYVVRLPHGALRKLWFIARYARRQPADAVVHFHVAAMGRFRWVAPLLFWCFRRQPKYLTLHSGLLLSARLRGWEKAYLRELMGRCRRLIPVNQELADALTALGIASARMAVIPAYIAQTASANAAPAAVAHLDGTPTLVTTSGFLMPLYNFDVLLDILPQLDAARYHFCFAFYGQTDPAYEARILRRLGKFANVTILRDQPSDVFLGLLAASDLYVRTTVTDGDALTIREALDLGIEVFATDCVQRPAACRLFRHDDAASLLALFAQPRAPRSRAQAAGGISNVQRVLELYPPGFE